MKCINELYQQEKEWIVNEFNAKIKEKRLTKIEFNERMNWWMNEWIVNE